MKKRTLLSSVSVLALVLHVQAGELVLRYDTPANDTMTEALPVGNGMLGGMIHGKPELERVVLNEISLWTGDEKTATGGYDEMGSYQTLGILNIDTLAKSGAGEAKVPMVVCASGQLSYYQREGIEASTDNNPGTKWCVVPDGVPLIWELRLPEARVISQYAFTSAGDVQERDPSTWTFSGSSNGKAWTVLDNHENEPPFAKRCETKTYTCTNDTAFKFYRVTFAPKKNPMHFQIAEISIPGVVFPGKVAPDKVENYSRALDLATATHRVTYKVGDVTYCRETFASKPDQVMVMRLTADKPGACGGAVLLKGGHREVTRASNNELQFSGVLANNLKYMTSVRVLNEGGSVQEGEGLIYYTACDSVTILLAASTDYTSDHSTQYRGGDPKTVVEKRLAKAAKKKYDVLKVAHVKEFQSYFNRVELDVGATPAERLALPTNKRKSLHAEKGGDADLEELMFQYGRYLLISCSRPGGLPANLQGMWNDNNNPPWHSDYHANINVQMNYWLAEPANLSPNVIRPFWTLL
jgi:alpha-L-fucosidase 2